MRYIRVAPLCREISAIGFGCASLGSRVSAKSGRRALDRAFAAGVTWYDVAPPYGDGLAEAILGGFLRGRREKVVVCTKFGIARPVIPFYKRLLRPLVRRAVVLAPALRTAASKARPTGGRARIDVSSIQHSVDQSLRRLGVDYIDVLAVHEPSVQEVADDRIFEVLARLIERGVVRALSLAGTPESVSTAITMRPSLSFLQFPDDPIANVAPRLREIAAPCDPPRFVTHGVFSDEAVRRLGRLRLTRPAEWRFFADEYAISPDASASEILLQFAFANNPDGIVLTSMFSPEHTSFNCAAAATSTKPDFAGDLRRLLANEDSDERVVRGRSLQERRNAH